MSRFNLLNNFITQSFKLDVVGTDVLCAFIYFGAGAFLLSGALFASNAAFSASGKPLPATMTGWLRNGVPTLHAGLWLTSIYEASGVICAQALVGRIGRHICRALALGTSAPCRHNRPTTA